MLAVCRVVQVTKPSGGPYLLSNFPLTTVSGDGSKAPFSGFLLVEFPPNLNRKESHPDNIIHMIYVQEM